MSDYDPYGSTRLPADVDRPDTLMFGLTARQILVVAVVGVGLWVVWMLASPHVPLPVLAVITVPIAAAGLAVAVGRRDGLPLDRWIAAALLHQLRRKHLAPAGTGPAAQDPAWVRTTASRRGGPARPAAPGLLRMPVRDIARGGVIDLGRDGHAAIAACTTVNFALRTPDEQAALVAGFGSWLNGLDSPAQIVVRTHRVDLTGLADLITDTAPALAHPALEAAARSHAEFIRDLADTHELLHRGVLVAVRQPGTGSHTAARAAHTAERTAATLAACEVNARVLDGPATRRVIADAADPYRTDQPNPDDDDTAYAPPDAVITASHNAPPIWQQPYPDEQEVTR
ncbi:hypothetical protein GCM10009765_03420 [Fodinicola feengrottensis]|uniref:PrgI family protein n=1 Tax=Fodinicola feengrottensis TaxID=435914 RepID=A0ABN2FS66_9ACTN